MQRLILILASTCLSSTAALSAPQRLHVPEAGTIVFDLGSDWSLINTIKNDDHSVAYEYVSPADASMMSWDKRLAVLLFPGQQIRGMPEGIGWWSAKTFRTRCTTPSRATLVKRADSGNADIRDFSSTCAVQDFDSIPEDMYLRAVEVQVGSVFSTKGQPGFVLVEYYQHFGTLGDTKLEDRDAGKAAEKADRAFINNQLTYCPPSIAAADCN